MEIIKTGDDYLGGVDLKTKDKILSIYIGGTLDVYFSLISLSDNSFTISKEEELIFNIFSNLLDEINNHEKAPHEKNNGCPELYNHSEDTIIYHSDEGAFDKSNILLISRKENEIMLCFRALGSGNYLNNEVRIRNSGSKYNGYNVYFNNLLYNLLGVCYQNNYKKRK